MANPALGRKFTCHSCGAKFYDLNKPEPACPKCGTAAQIITLEPTGKGSRGGAKRGRAVPVYEPKVEEEAEPAFEEDEAGPAFEDEDTAFEDEDAAFEDDDAAEGEPEEPAAEEEET
ncbi:MAG: FYDLN acid domain-containing protein [Bradymonadia bacterium]